MTVPRMFAAFIAFMFVFFLIKKFPKQGFEILAVKVFACLALLTRIITVIMLYYYSRNPTKECFVSEQAANALTYMDIAAFGSIAAFMWQYLR